MSRVLIFVFMLFVLHPSVCIAQVISVAPEYEERYEHLLSELRCLVCQNQTVAESPADLSNDLRVEVKEMLERGATDEEIFKFMSDRYGDFVLYNPPVKPRTYLLWIGPFVLLIGGIILAILLVRKRSNSAVNNDLNDQDKQRLKDLLDEENKKT